MANKDVETISISSSASDEESGEQNNVAKKNDLETFQTIKLPPGTVIRVCLVQNCKNKRMVTKPANKYLGPGKEFYHFPEDGGLRDKWMTILFGPRAKLIGDPKWLFICEDHYQQLNDRLKCIDQKTVVSAEVNMQSSKSDNSPMVFIDQRKMPEVSNIDTQIQNIVNDDILALKDNKCNDQGKKTISTLENVTVTTTAEETKPKKVLRYKTGDRTCVVPECKNRRAVDQFNYYIEPGRLFVKFPRQESMKLLWAQRLLGDIKEWAVRNDENVENLDNYYICEDHFDLKKYMVNYHEYLTKGFVKHIILRKDCVPFKTLDRSNSGDQQIAPSIQMCNPAYHPTNEMQLIVNQIDPIGIHSVTKHAKKFKKIATIPNDDIEEKKVDIRKINPNNDEKEDDFENSIPRYVLKDPLAAKKQFSIEEEPLDIKADPLDIKQEPIYFDNDSIEIKQENVDSETEDFVGSASDTDSINSFNLVKCDFCTYEFENETDLVKHVQSIHVDSKPSAFKCDRCLVFFETENNIIEHYALTHRLALKFKCKECVQFFDKEADVTNHFIAVHKKEIEEKAKMAANNNKNNNTNKSLRTQKQYIAYKKPAVINYDDVRFNVIKQPGPKEKAKKSCFIVTCINDNQLFPDKHFFTVPSNYERRVEWYRVAKRKARFVSAGEYYCCEDHFDMEKDVFWTWHLNQRKLQVKPGVLPHIFDDDYYKFKGFSWRKLYNREKIILLKERLKNEKTKKITEENKEEENKIPSIEKIAAPEDKEEPNNDLLVPLEVTRKLDENKNKETTGHICEICNKEFALQKHWKEHLDHVHGRGEYHCDYCNLQFNNKRYLSKHITKQHGLGPRINRQPVKVECDHCHKTFKSRDCLTHHMHNCHSDSAKCQICQLVCASRPYLLTHMRRQHGGKRRKRRKILVGYRKYSTLKKCPHCSKRFRNFEEHLNKCPQITEPEEPDTEETSIKIEFEELETPDEVEFEEFDQTSKIEFDQSTSKVEFEELELKECDLPLMNKTESKADLTSVKNEKCDSGDWCI